MRLNFKISKLVYCKISLTTVFFLFLFYKRNTNNFISIVLSEARNSLFPSNNYDHYDQWRIVSMSKRLLSVK